MRFATIGLPGQERPAVVRGSRAIPVADLDSTLPASPRALIAGNHLPRLGELAALAPAHAGVPVAGVRLGPPVTDPSKIICVGLNYRGHATEQGKPWPEEPLLFCKSPGTLAGCRDPIVLPDDDLAHIDYEVELCVVIGRRCRRVAAADALGVVAGVMVANDVSARGWQKRDGQWFRAKSSDGFLPTGPALVTLDDCGPLPALHLTTDVWGRRVQDALASDLIHDVPALIAWISRWMTLEPGDLISTGTPAGVGCYLTPPRFLAAGDTVTCAIDGLGELINPVVAGP